MKKILMAFAEPFEFGGQEIFALNIYKYIDHSKYSIDFFTPYNLSNEKAIEMLKENENQFFYFNKKFDSILRKKNFKYCFEKFIKEHNDYEVVHINSGSTYALAEGAKICKKNGIKKVIVHSHATGFSSFKHKVTNLLLSYKFKYADTFIACSDKAAEFRFPKKIINSKKYIVLKNGIDIDKFKYNLIIRREYRKKLNIEENEFVIGNVGRLSVEKNQKFIIDIFEKLIEKNEKCKLLMVGNGILKNEIIKYIKNKKLAEKFILLQNRSDINNILQAMDVFLFPSLFEGLGIAAIEAQASGLPTICSENVPNEANISELFERIPLNSKSEWVNRIENYIQINEDNRKNMSSIIREKGYDSKESAKKLEYLYMNL